MELMPLMPRCGTCRWWATPTAPVLWGECRTIDDSPDVNSPRMAQTDPAFLLPCESDDDHEVRRLQTHPTFGCILWTPKQ